MTELHFQTFNACFIGGSKLMLFIEEGALFQGKGGPPVLE